MKIIHSDCLIIGEGLAGLTSALTLSRLNRGQLKIDLISRSEDSSTSHAQGGIIYEANHPTELARDIFEASDFTAYQKAIEILCSEGPRRVEEILVDLLKIPFNQNQDGSFHFNQEAAHSEPRILHVKDETGSAISHSLKKVVLEEKNIFFHSHHTAIELITLSHNSKNPQDIYEPLTCIGAYLLDHETKEVYAIVAKKVILASGGVGSLYLHSTNPINTRGDGIAMAYRVGARILNMEYIQFHPTSLYLKDRLGFQARRFLITEALRGRGAKLVNEERREFLQHPLKSLAPRDVVAREIHNELMNSGKECVYLDAAHHVSADILKKEFHSIYETCFSFGIDITKDPIPVVPAAHYLCGGIYVNERGETTVRNLYAVGETACTGLHGANRLASTSLLECLVWGVRAAEDITQKLKNYFPPSVEINDWEVGEKNIDPAHINQDWLTLKQTMWNYVGLIRSPERLRRAHRIISELRSEAEDYYVKGRLTDSLIGIRNGLQVALLIIRACQQNRESRGTHYLQL